MRRGVDKWKVLHLGSANPQHPYKGHSHTIPTVAKHRDLGVTISSDIDFSHHIKKAKINANNILFSIHRIHWSRDASLMNLLYTSHIRPLLEFAFNGWSLIKKYFILALERVQRRATHMIEGFHHMPYHKRVDQLKLSTFMHRRSIADLCALHASTISPTPHLTSLISTSSTQSTHMILRSNAQMHLTTKTARLSIYLTSPPQVILMAAVGGDPTSHTKT
eukprot:GHVN01032658.1.p1 GENE.GHVN01032658.1~~GHVN01032658.1.p1  ORF type:complete len:220 (-),score=18.56 GHVN01032658.1:443-1102(-)